MSGTLAQCFQPALRLSDTKSGLYPRIAIGVRYSCQFFTHLLNRWKIEVLFWHTMNFFIKIKIKFAIKFEFELVLELELYVVSLVQILS